MKPRKDEIMSIQYFNHESFYQHTQDHKPVVVMYSANWCSFCRNLTSSYHDLANKYDQEFMMGVVNVDLYPTLEQAADIKYLPTFILYQNGKELGRIVNPPNIDTVELFITEHVHIISDAELKAFESFQALIFS